jgi:hypothetical protein
MQSLIKILLKIPGLQPNQISSGLKVPPLKVFFADNEQDAEKLKNLLEKFGAVCTIEDTKKMVSKKEESEKKVTGSMEAYLKHRHHHSLKFRRKFWISILSIFVVFAIITSIDFSCENKQIQQNQPKNQIAQSVNIPDSEPEPDSKPQNKNNSTAAVSANIAKINSELKKNPYNADAWKNLADNLEKQGDTVAARKAKESFEKSVKAQQVFASLAKAFGNKVRIEVTENEVYYRTSYDFTDDEFNAEVVKLMDSLSVKFPGKNLIVENYTSDNRIQSKLIKSKTKPK